MQIQQFIRKLNNTELNSQSTNDAYIRVSKEIQDYVPKDFFEPLNSKNVVIINKGTKSRISEDKWLRYQFYPANNEFRIVSLTEIYNTYNPFPGDFIIIEKILDGAKMHYEVSMKKISKLSMKFSKSSNDFEILNLQQDSNADIIDKDLIIKYNGITIDSKIVFSERRKKRSDSPAETDFYEILNFPQEVLKTIGKDSFVELQQKAGEFYLKVEKSWEFNSFER